MDYRRLFADVRRRPDAYFLDGSFRDAVAFVTGCDAGNAQGLLIGFSEWLAIRLDCEADLPWPELVVMAARVPVASADIKNGVDESINARLVDTLFALLDEFLDEKRGAVGASMIITGYLNRCRAWPNGKTMSDVSEGGFSRCEG